MASMQLKTITNLVVGVILTATFISCTSRICGEIDQAFEYLNADKTADGAKLINSLLQENTEEMSVYDMSNLGLAAMVFGIESNDIQMAEKGYELSQVAIRKDAEVCNEMLKYELYVDAFGDDYVNVVKDLYSHLNDIYLSQMCIGSWSTTYNNYLWNETQRFNETLTLNADNTFSESLVVNARGNADDYIVEFTGYSTIEGKWNIESGVLSLRYNNSTIQTEIPEKSFKFFPAPSAFYSGNLFESAFTASLNEKGVKKSTERALYNMVDELYQQSEPSYNLSFEDNDMVLRTLNSTLTYTKQQ